MNNYLNEAFKQLEMLNEEEFNLNDKDAVKDMKDFMGIDVDDSVEVIDPNAETEDDLEDSYVGKVILDCVVCHSKQYKDPDEVVIDEAEELANVGEECPFCYTSDGFKVVGQVAPFDEDEVNEIDDGEVADEPEDEEGEADQDDFMESLKAKISSMNEAEISDEDKKDNQILRRIYNKTQRRANAALTPEEQAVLDKYGLYRSTGNKDIMMAGKDAYHANTITSPHNYFVGGVDVHDDRVNLADRARKMPNRQPTRDYLRSGEYNVSDTTFDHDPKGKYNKTFQRKMNTANSAQMQKPVFDMRRLIHDRNYEQGRLDKADANYKSVIAKAKADYERRMKDAEDTLAHTKKYASKNVDQANSEIDRMLKRDKKEGMDESLEQVTVTNDSGKLVVTNDDDTNSITVNSQSTIVPVSDEVEDKIIADSNLDAGVDATDSVEDFDIDDFDEGSFDELGESYLTRIYENVDKYATSKVSQNGNKVIIEGNITFKSGNVKPTQFMFEPRINKGGKVRLLGENKQISRGKKTFTLSGSLADKKFVCESFNYNYRGKDSQTGKSVRLYGTLKRGMSNG